MSTMEEQAADAAAPKWKPISAIERRVLGVLGEKAKTTPDAYPLSLNALTNGCNQKSNRYPQMNLEPIQVEDALERLRGMGAVSEVQGASRVARYRHYLYEWLGVSKVESAVMIELLLRGSQTVGELRGRAARMEPIADVAELRPVLQELINRQLVLSLTPEGRGQIVAHALYQPQELEKVQREAASQAATNAGSPASPSRDAPARPAATSGNAVGEGELANLRDELQQLREQVKKMASEIEDIWSNIGQRAN